MFKNISTAKVIILGEINHAFKKLFLKNQLSKN